MIGRWVGVQNLVGNLGGALAPLVTGRLLDLTGSFRWPFYVTAVAAWVGAVGWCLVVGPLEEIDWRPSPPRVLPVEVRPAPQT
jgi:MFS family permease